MADTEAVEQRAGARRFARLPEPVRLEDTIASQDPAPPPDPERGRNTDRDFMLRYGAPL